MESLRDEGEMSNKRLPGTLLLVGVEWAGRVCHSTVACSFCGRSYQQLLGHCMENGQLLPW